MTRGTRLTAFLALSLLAALIVFLSTDETHATPPPFDPGGIVCMENLDTTGECDGDTSPNAATDVLSKFCVGWNADCSVKDAPVTDSNFGGIVAFTPTEWNLPKGDTIPIGAIAGRLESEATLGLFNGPCGPTPINVAFTMLNASINTGETIAPREEGETDVMQPLAQDVNPANGVPDGADKYPSFLAEFFSANGTPLQPRARLFGITQIQLNWVTLNFVFFEPGTTLEVGQTVITFNPALGYPSITILQDPTSQAAPSAITDFCAPLFSNNIALGKTFNNPCTPTKVTGANCPVTSDADPEIPDKGYPAFPCDPRSNFDDDGDGKVNDGCPQVLATAESGAQCDNNTSDDPEDAAVNDGCQAIGDAEGSRAGGGGCSGADEAGCTYRSNPGAGGSYTFISMALSQRDADGDGIENGLDVCFDKANGEWNPRAEDLTNDPDKDGLPSACDPKPNEVGPVSPQPGCKSGYTGYDEDEDCFANRADNCPLKESLEDPNQPPNQNTNKPSAPDDDSDGIGDACDPDPAAVNGDYIGYCVKFALNVGGAGGSVVGVKQDTLAPACAAQGEVVQQPQGTGIVTPTPGPGTATARPGSTGIGGAGSSGVGSLSPTATDLPVWAAILAGIGAAGVVSGIVLYTRLAPRKQR